MLTRGLMTTVGLAGLAITIGLLLLIKLGQSHFGSLAVGNSIAFTAFALCLIVAAVECRSETATAVTMPGLMRGVARTAVIAGTATAVSNRVSRRRANRWARQEDEQYARDQSYQQQQQQPAQAAAPDKDTVTQLKELADLKSAGILTDEESRAQKAKILGS